jgi:hypothetical protein
LTIARHHEDEHCEVRKARSNFRAQSINGPIIQSQVKLEQLVCSEKRQAGSLSTPASSSLSFQKKGGANEHGSSTPSAPPSPWLPTPTPTPPSPYTSRPAPPSPSGGFLQWIRTKTRDDRNRSAGGRCGTISVVPRVERREKRCIDSIVQPPC